MKKSLILMVVGAILLAATNPEEEAYAEWRARSLQDTICETQQPPACQIVGVIPPVMLRQMIRQYSDRRNFIFFSLYTTRFAHQRVSSIGIGRSFLPLET